MVSLENFIKDIVSNSLLSYTLATDFFGHATKVVSVQDMQGMGDM